MSPADPVNRQAGAIPIKDGLVCLVTSRTLGTWIPPKGNIDPGHTPAQAAEQEAWEEAGVRGDIGPEPIGSFRYSKYGTACEVILFRVEVTEVADSWPEMGLRERKWCSAEDVRAIVTIEDLKAVVLLALGADNS